jgi:hypothetical protein
MLLLLLLLLLLQTMVDAQGFCHTCVGQVSCHGQKHTAALFSTATLSIATMISCIYMVTCSATDMACMLQ